MSEYPNRKRENLVLDKLKGKKMPSTCPCGSKEWPEANYDGYGIFLCYTCDKCHKQKMAGYRSDIFEHYECDEPIEGD